MNAIPTHLFGSSVTGCLEAKDAMALAAAFPRAKGPGYYRAIAAREFGSSAAHRAEECVMGHAAVMGNDTSGALAHPELHSRCDTICAQGNGEYIVFLLDCSILYLSRDAWRLVSPPTPRGLLCCDARGGNVVMFTSAGLHYNGEKVTSRVPTPPFDITCAAVPGLFYSRTPVAGIREYRKGADGAWTVRRMPGTGGHTRVLGKVIARDTYAALVVSNGYSIDVLHCSYAEGRRFRVAFTHYPDLETSPMLRSPCSADGYVAVGHEYGTSMFTIIHLERSGHRLVDGAMGPGCYGCPAIVMENSLVYRNTIIGRTWHLDLETGRLDFHTLDPTCWWVRIAHDDQSCIVAKEATKLVRMY